MPHLIVCLWDNLVISVRLVPQGFLCQTLGILRVAIKNVCIKKVKVFISLPTLSSFFKILPKFQTYYMFLPCWAQTGPGDGTTDRSSFWHNIWRVVRSSSSVLYAASPPPVIVGDVHRSFGSARFRIAHRRYALSYVVRPIIFIILCYTGFPDKGFQEREKN